jgi:cytochrome c556
MFPPDSKTGATSATAKVWESPAEFNAALDNYVATVRAASAAVKDEASLKVEYPKIVEGCGACHGRRGGFAPGLSESFKRMEEPL